MLIPYNFCAIVSIHAPREGCDLTTCYTKTEPPKFQFTHPGRGATAWIFSSICGV